jgi:hypothetical protein
LHFPEIPERRDTSSGDLESFLNAIRNLEEVLSADTPGGKRGDKGKEKEERPLRERTESRRIPVQEFLNK